MDPRDVVAEAWAGRLFVHRHLNDPTTGGPLYCRVRGVEVGLVEYEVIHHQDDGSERIGSPWRLPIEHFVEATFGGWYEGTTPPTAIPRGGEGSPGAFPPRQSRGAA